MCYDDAKVSSNRKQGVTIRESFINNWFVKKGRRDCKWRLNIFLVSNDFSLRLRVYLSVYRFVFKESKCSYLCVFEVEDKKIKRKNILFRGLQNVPSNLSDYKVEKKHVQFRKNGILFNHNFIHVFSLSLSLCIGGRFYRACSSLVKRIPEFRLSKVD